MGDFLTVSTKPRANMGSTEFSLAVQSQLCFSTKATFRSSKGVPYPSPPSFALLELHPMCKVSLHPHHCSLTLSVLCACPNLPERNTINPVLKNNRSYLLIAQSPSPHIEAFVPRGQRETQPGPGTVTLVCCVATAVCTMLCQRL